MNELLHTNTGASAVAAQPDQYQQPYGLEALVELIRSMSKGNQTSHMDQLTIRMTPEVLALLKETSRRTHQPMAQIVRICLLYVLKGDQTGSTEGDGESMKESSND